MPQSTLPMASSTTVSKSSKWLFSNKIFFNKLSFPCLSTRSTLPKSLPPPTNTTDLIEPLTRPSNSNGYIAKEDDKLKQVFDHLDVDKDGKISSKELMDYFASTGDSVSHEVAKSVVNEFDSDGDGLLDFGDFDRLMRQDDKGELEGVLRSAFEMFEVEIGRGCITPKGLQHMLRQLLGEVKSHDECAAMIRAFDLDGNGFLDFHEFQRMMSQTT